MPGFGRQFSADLHESKPQEIGTAPVIRIGGHFVVLAKPDAPDQIEWACLHQNLRSRLAEESAQIPVLGELGLIRPDHYCEMMANELFFPGASHLTPKCFRRGRVGSPKNLASYLHVAEQACLL